MKRSFQANSLDIGIYPSGKDQTEVGMYVELERKGWKKNLFVPDATIARLVGREIYYALVCEFFPDDFQTRPTTPDPVIYRRIRRKSSSSRIRRTPHEVGVEAEPYDKGIVDVVAQSSHITEIGEAKLRVEKVVFQSIQNQFYPAMDNADSLWWDIKHNLTLLVVCWRTSLLVIPEDMREEVQTLGEAFALWRSMRGLNTREMTYESDGTLTALGNGVVEAISPTGTLNRLFASCRIHRWFTDDEMMVQAAMSAPEVDGQMLLSLDQSRAIQIVLVIILFGVLVAGVGSFISENRKMMRMIEALREEKN